MAKVATQKERERRRLRAGRLLLKGIAQAEVARRIGVAPSTVSGWAKRVHGGGLESLRSTGELGRPRGLDDAQRRELARALKAGAMAHGFPTELWTLPRVGRLIASQFELKYSGSQVWRILRALGFSPQRPSKRALERDEQAIRQWQRKRWPTLKKTLPDSGGLSCLSTSRD